MGTNYNSIERIFRATNLAEITLNPPNDITIVRATGVASRSVSQPINPNSNLIVNSVGLFSNFADGVVFKTPYKRFSAIVRVWPVSWGATVGLGACDFTSKTITGDGAVGQDYAVALSQGMLVKINNHVGIVNTTAVNSFTLYDYPDANAGASGVVYRNISLYQPRSFQIDNISELNTMYDIGANINIQNVINLNFPIDNIIVTIEIVPRDNVSVVMTTKNMSSSYIADTMFLDGVCSVTYTGL